MCGRLTLTMVVSRISMNAASGDDHRDQPGVGACGFQAASDWAVAVAHDGLPAVTSRVTSAITVGTTERPSGKRAPSDPCRDR